MDGVVETQKCGSILSHRGSLREDIEAGLRCLRVKLTAAAQLLDGAHHAVGFDAAKLAGLDGYAVLGQGTAVMAAGYLAAVQNHGNHIANLHVVGAGDDLQR